MDVDFVQRNMRQKSYPSEKVAPPKISKKIKSRKFRNKNNGFSNQQKNVFDLEPEFNEPEYLNDIGYHLVCDIENLKKEVIPLRKQVFTYMKLESNLNKLPAEAACLDVLDIDPRQNVDFSERVNDLNLQLTELTNEYNQMKEYYKNSTKIQFEQDLLNFNDKITNLNLKINKIQNVIKESKSKIDQINESEAKIRYEKNLNKIIELSKLKNKLETYQQNQIDMYYDFSKSQMPDPDLQNQLENLQRQYHSIKYIKSQRKVELNKLSKKYDEQRQCMYSLIEKRELPKKSSKRNLKMCRRFTQQNSYSSMPMEQSEQDESNVYYVADTEVQTNDIGPYQNTNLAPRRYHHHRRKTRRHSPQKKPGNNAKMIEFDDETAYNNDRKYFAQYDDNRTDDDSIQDDIRYIHNDDTIDNHIFRTKNEKIEDAIQQLTRFEPNSNKLDHSIKHENKSPDKVNDKKPKIEDTVEKFAFIDNQDKIVNKITNDKIEAPVENGFVNSNETAEVKSNSGDISNKNETKETIVKEISGDENNQIEEIIIDETNNSDTIKQANKDENIPVEEIIIEETNSSDNIKQKINDDNQIIKESNTEINDTKETGEILIKEDDDLHSDNLNQLFDDSKNKTQTISPKQVNIANESIASNKPHFALTFAKEVLGFCTSSTNNENSSSYENTIVLENELNSDHPMRKSNDSFNQLAEQQPSNDDDGENNDNQEIPFGNGHLPYIPLKVIQVPVV